MSNASFYSVQKLPTTSQDAIREFDARYIAAIGVGVPDSWADIGAYIPTSSPWTTYPVGAFALAFQRTRGEQRFKKLASKSFDIKAEEFDEGYQAPLASLLTNDFAYAQWNQAPQRLVIAEGNLRNQELIALIEAGESKAWIDGVNFFSATHLSDVTNSTSATWSNYQSSPKSVLSVANITAEVIAMQGVRDENGKKLGVDPDTIMVPTEVGQSLINLLAKELILDSSGTVAESNPYAKSGKFKVVVNKDLTNADDWYLIDSKLISQVGLPPWITLRWDVPTNSALAMRYWDESSDFFKNTGEIKASKHVWYGSSLGFPHPIRKVKGA